MKEITRIHLASLPYNIEIVAKKELEKYLASIEKSLSADEDAMREIEARMAEILTENGVTGEKVVTSKDMEAIFAQLGEPKDFADESALEEEKITVKGEKRLYRDTDRQMLAGVCSGIAAYFKIDVTIVRLIAIVLAFASFGTALLLYIVMAIITPAAKTAAQKLEMSGEPVTLAALKEQSAVAVEPNASSQVFLRVISVLVGAGLLMGAIAVISGLAYATLMSQEYVFKTGDWWVVASAFAVGIAGLSFVVVCLLLAYIAFSWKFNKKIGTALVALIIGGTLLFGTGAVGLRFQGPWYSNSVYETTSLDRNFLNGIKRIELKGGYENPVQISYNVTTGDEKPNAEYSYTVFDDENNPKVALEKIGETLFISVNAEKCEQSRYCGNPMVDIFINGPELSEIVNHHGNSNVNYSSNNQDSLTVRLSKSGSFTLGSGSKIKNLTASVGNHSSLDTSLANVESANLNIESRNSDVNLGQLKSINIDTPESCSARDESSDVGIRFEGAGLLTIRGEAYNPDITYPCLDLERGESGTILD